MKKKLLSCGLILSLLGLCLFGAGQVMGGSTWATVHLFGHDIWVYCMPVSFVYSRSYATSSTPIPSPAAEVYDDSYGYCDISELPPFQTIDIDLDIGNVYIMEGDSYSLSLDWYGADYALRYSSEGGTLKVWSEGSVGDVNLYSGTAQNDIQYVQEAETVVVEDGGPAFTYQIPHEVQNLSDASGDVFIYVPGEPLEKLDCRISLGDLYIDSLAVESAELTLQLGDLFADRFTVDHSLEVKSALGDVDLYGSFQGKTDIEANLGNVYLAGVLRDKVEIDADLGDVTLHLVSPISEYSWKLDVGMGYISVWDENGSYNQNSSGSKVTGGSGSSTLDISVSMGNISVGFNL